MTDTSERRSRSRALHILTALILGVAGSLAALSLVPPLHERIGPASITVGAGLGKGATILRIPPFGTVSAGTHGAPLRLTATLTELDPQGVARGLATDQSRAALIDEMATGLRRAATRAAVRLAIGGLVIGGLIAGLLPGRHLRGVVIGSVGGLVATSILLLVTSRGYDVGAFGEPRFSGTLERAPDLLQAVQKQGTAIADIRSKYRIGAERLAEIVSLAAAPNQNPRAGTVAVLHVSDIHSNPLGIEFAKQLAERFDVDAILDTGDLTSFGQPIEARIGQLLSGIGRPWLVVPGNHDAPEVRQAMAAVPNVVVLDQRVEQVGDVSILGWGDPTFTPGSPITNAEARRRQYEESPKVAQRVREVMPDVLAVHNADLARDATGEVALVLSGHRHKGGQRKKDGTIYLAVGSTGATGLGSFLVEAELAYEAQIVYFRDGRPVAVDYIRFRTLGTDFEIQRRTLVEDESVAPVPGGSPAPSPTPAATPTPTPAPSPAG